MSRADTAAQAGQEGSAIRATMADPAGFCLPPALARTPNVMRVVSLLPAAPRVVADWRLDGLSV